MQVEITEDALNFLLDKNANEITIDYVNSKQCCGSGLPSSDTYIGPFKRRKHEYKVINCDNFKVNVDKLLIFKEDIIKIDLIKFAFTKTLTSNFLDYNKLI